MIQGPYIALVPGFVLVTILVALHLAGALPILASSRRWLPVLQPKSPRIVQWQEAWLIMTLALPVLLLILYDRPPGFDSWFERTRERSGHRPLMFLDDAPLKVQVSLARVLGAAVSAVVIAGLCSWRLSTATGAAVLTVVLGFSGREFAKWQQSNTDKILFARSPPVGQIQPHSLTSDPNIDRLLDWARLENYQPPPEWYEALLSYQRKGWDQLRRESYSEPELLRLADGCAKHVYQLDQIRTAEQAWAALMKISAEAVAKQRYESDRCEGRAVELLVPQLDPEQLTRVLQRSFAKDPDPLIRHRLNTAEADEPLWQPSRPWDPRPPREFLANQPLFHAAWRLDRTLNDQQPDQPNLVEQRVTPALLRHVIRDPNRVLPYADALGGPVYEQFLLRHDWRNGPDEFPVLDQNQQSARWFVNLLSRFDSDARSQFDLFESVAIGNTRVNRWLYSLMYLDSAGGRQFRQENRERLLQIAVRSLQPVPRRPAKTESERTMRLIEAALTSSMSPGNPSATPPHLDFLFLDRGFTADQKSLAMEFWPYFDRTTASSRNVETWFILRLRWNYLARMWPESTVEMFVKAYPPQRPDHYTIWGLTLSQRSAHYLVPTTLPHDVRFAILSGVRDSLQQKLRSLPEPQHALQDQSKTVIEIDDLEWCSYQIPCRASAVAFLESYQRDHSQDKLDQLRARMVRDPLHNDLVELLARHEDPELRSVALIAIRNHPIPRRVKLLDALRNDAVLIVRDEATKIEKELAELRTHERLLKMQ